MLLSYLKTVSSYCGYMVMVYQQRGSRGRGGKEERRGGEGSKWEEREVEKEEDEKRKMGTRMG